MQKLKKFIYSQIFIFGLVAGASAIFELILYTSLFEIFKLDPIISSPIGQIVSMMFNFTLNKLFTFKTGKAFKIKEVTGYIGVWLVNLFITTVLMAYLINNSHIYPTVIRLGVMVLMFFFNFIALKRLVFKKD